MSYKELIKKVKELELELYLIGTKYLPNFKNIKKLPICFIDALDEKNVSYISKIQQLDKELYGGIGADHWVVYTFGAKAGFMLVLSKPNFSEIISYSQTVGCIDPHIVQLWGLGTNKIYQRRGFGTLTYKLTKEFCKLFRKKTLEINVEPENISMKIYVKDNPIIKGYGQFYPNQSPRLILSVSLN